MSTEEKCKDCKYFLPTRDTSGRCHRYPPTVVEGVYTEDEYVRSDTYNFFPVVEADEFCGEFKEIK